MLARAAERSISFMSISSMLIAFGTVFKIEADTSHWTRQTACRFWPPTIDQ
jgi:hypothetical protein